MRLALTALAVGTLFVAAPSFAQPAPAKPPNPNEAPAALPGQKGDAEPTDKPAVKVDEASVPPASRIPPPPPRAGAPQPGADPPPAPPSPFGGDEGPEQEELAGFRGGFFLRDRRDYFRLFPEAWLGVDVNSTFGPGVSQLPASRGGHDVTTKIALGRARLGLEGELLRRWNFMVSVDFGGQALGNTSGTETTAGQTAPLQTTTPNVALADAWLEYHLCNCLSLMVGQFNAPIGIENRTADPFTPFRARNLAIRGLVAPGSKDLGAMAFGYFGERFFNYELGVFEGDGPNKPGVDSRVDFVGRIFVRPLAGRGAGDFGRTAQIGVSARLGERDPTRVGADVPAITTGQGFALWRPTYTDRLGRVEHVIPSGGQAIAGGELRFEVWRVAFQAEAYFVDDHTREAIDGFQLTNVERIGRLKGAGWYAQLSGWPFGDAFVRPEPGIIQPRQLDLHATPGRPKRGLELLAIVSGIDATYDGAARGGVADPAAPPANISLYQIGFAAQYWHTQHVRLALDYALYVAPGSGNTSPTVVPDNLVVSTHGAVGDSHVLHELGARFSLAL